MAPTVRRDSRGLSCSPILLRLRSPGCGLRHHSFPSRPLSNLACSFPAHGLTMIFLVWLAPGISRFRAVDTDPYPQTVHETTSQLHERFAARRAGPSIA